MKTDIKKISFLAHNFSSKCKIFGLLLPELLYRFCIAWTQKKPHEATQKVLTVKPIRQM